MDNNAFEWGKLLICHLKGNWQMDRILIILKTNGPRASSAPAFRLNTIIFKHVGICSRSQLSVYRTIGPLVF